MPAPAPSFDHHPRTRLVFGAGSLARLAELTRSAGITRPLLVSDPGVQSAGHVAAARAALEADGLSIALHTDVIENPTESAVEACADAARAAGVDGLIGLGGGSSLDTARAATFLLAAGGRMRDYQGYDKVGAALLPLIAVPTTAGTGSECQSYALISEDGTHRKMACGARAAAARVALLDPELTLTLPRAVTIATGLDAIVHAIESAVTTKRTPVSALYARGAFERLAPSFPRVLNDPAGVRARGEMIVGAAFAGLAIENSMLGAAHAAANPLTAGHGVVHGRAVALLLPHVVRFNLGQLGRVADPRTLEATRRQYADLARAVGWADPASGEAAASDALLEGFEDLLRAADVEPTLAGLGLDESALARLAEQASSQWTGRFNPRPIDRDGFLDLYRAAWQAGSPRAAPPTLHARSER